MGNQIYILPSLGYRHPVNEWEQIKWYWENHVKIYRGQSAKTKFWLDTLERYEKALVDRSAFELLGFLKSKASDESVKKRALWKAKHKLKSEIEITNFRNWFNDYKSKHDLINNGTKNQN